MLIEMGEDHSRRKDHRTEVTEITEEDLGVNGRKRDEALYAHSAGYTTRQRLEAYATLAFQGGERCLKGTLPRGSRTNSDHATD
jgi:hypothetical protein